MMHARFFTADHIESLEQIKIEEEAQLMRMPKKKCDNQNCGKIYQRARGKISSVKYELYAKFPIYL